MVRVRVDVTKSQTAPAVVVSESRAGDQRLIGQQFAMDNALFVG